MTENFHNALGGNSADQLRAYIARIERLEAEVAEMNACKADIFKEIKSCGFCKDTIRKVVRRRRKCQQELKEQDDLIELYEAAMAFEDDPLNT